MQVCPVSIIHQLASYVRSSSVPSQTSSTTNIDTSFGAIAYIPLPTAAEICFLSYLSSLRTAQAPEDVEAIANAEAVAFCAASPFQAAALGSKAAGDSGQLHAEDQRGLSGRRVVFARISDTW